jgi:[ribosomal protein S5]-alanine N-acetyltransferase
VISENPTSTFARAGPTLDHDRIFGSERQERVGTDSEGDGATRRCGQAAELGDLQESAKSKGGLIVRVNRLEPSSFDLGTVLPTITAQRVRLRWLTADDIPALYSIFGDPQVMRYWSHPALQEIAAAADYLADIHECFKNRTLFQWGLELISPNDGAQVIGTCTLAQLSADHERAELGFALARAHWGKGYMSEILPVLLDFAFQRLGLHRIWADVDPRNASSIKLLAKHGFQREGFLREHYLVNGERQDAVLYGLVRR